MSEVGHLIINGSLYVVLCHVFFAGESLDYLIFVGGEFKLDATLWRFFVKSENLCSVLVVLVYYYVYGR